MSERSKTHTYIYWKYKHKLPEINLTLMGHSRGSEKTGFYIPELKLFFDAGLQSMFNPKYIFITHCHSDHSAALPMLIQCINSNPLIVVPEQHVELFKEYCTSYFNLSNGIKSEHKINIEGATEKHTFPVGKFHLVKVFSLDHSVITNGYGLYENKKKLKPEIIALEKEKRIKIIKEAPNECFDYLLLPQLAFICDTSINVFKTHPELLLFKYLIIECTFYCDDTYNLAQKSKHIHYKDLKPYIEDNPSTNFILIHFSMRYKDIMIDNLPKNAFLWLN